MTISKDSLVRSVRPEVAEILQRAANELAAIDPQSVLLAVVVGHIKDGYLVSAEAHPAEGWKTEMLADVLSRLGREMGHMAKIH